MPPVLLRRAPRGRNRRTRFAVGIRGFRSSSDLDSNLSCGIASGGTRGAGGGGLAAGAEPAALRFLARRAAARAARLATTGPCTPSRALPKCCYKTWRKRRAWFHHSVPLHGRCASSLTFKTVAPRSTSMFLRWLSPRCRRWDVGKAGRVCPFDAGLSAVALRTTKKRDEKRL